MSCCGGCFKLLLKILLIIFNGIFLKYGGFTGTPLYWASGSVFHVARFIIQRDVILLLQLLGLVLLALGIIVMTTLSQYIKPYIDPLLKSLATFPSAFGTTGSTAAPPTIDLVSLLQPVAAALIAIGVIFILITFFGCCGACCNSRCLLIIYAVVYGIFIVVQCILIGLFFSQKLDSQLRNTLQTEVVNKYVDFDDYSMPSLLSNVIQLKVDSCCGIDNVNDYNTATNWRRTRDLTIGDNKTAITYTLATPLTCCKTSGEFPNISFNDTTCAVVPTPINSNWMTGCWGEVGTFLEPLRPQILAGTIIAIVVQIVFVLMACIVACLMDSKVGDATV